MRTALLASLLLMTPAAIAAPTPLDGMTEVERAVALPEQQRTARAALASLGFDLGGDRTTYGPRGRRDVTLFSAAPRETIVDTLKAAYRNSRILAHDVEVRGYAHIGLSDTHSFTLRVGTFGTMVVEVGAGPAGTELVLWGSVLNPAPPAAAPR